MEISTVCRCVSCAIYVNSISTSKWFVMLVVVGGIACGLPIIVETIANHMYSADEALYLSGFNKLGNAEYLPSSFRREYAEANKDTVTSNAEDFEITQHNREGLTFTFSYEVKDGGDDVYFSVPLALYTGYQAELTAADGTVTELNPEADDMGLVRVHTGGVDSGTIYVHYEKTTIQIVSEIISLTALVFVIVMKLHKKKESRS